MTAQDVINATSTDIRGVLQAGQAGDAATILGWVDRIQKEALHTSIYAPFNTGVSTVSTVAGTGTYTIAASDIRRVLQVYDRNFNRELLPYEMIMSPFPAGNAVAPPIGTPPEEQVRRFPYMDEKTQTPWARYFRYIAPQTLVIFPAPLTATYAGSLEVYYDQQVADITSTTQALVVPGDGKDLMVAGVNYLANMFLKRADEAKMWFEIYNRLKQGVAPL